MKRFILNIAGISGLLFMLAGCGTITGQRHAMGAKPAKAKMLYAQGGNRFGGRLEQANGMADSAPFVRQEGREIAYTANFNLEVTGRADFAKRLRILVKQEKGIITAIRGSVYELKIPAPRANAFLEKIRGCGKITDFNLESSDLTDELIDRKMRLDNLLKLRERLTQLLKKAQRVEDIIKIETKLAEVTREIERCNSQIKRSRNQVDYTNFTICITEKTPLMPQEEFTVRQFEFLHDVLNSKACPVNGKLDDLPLPEGFVRVNDSTACSMDNCIYRVWSVEVPESRPEFWYALVKRQLSGRFYASAREAGRIKSGKTAAGEYLQLPEPLFGTVLVILKPGCFLHRPELIIAEFFGKPDKIALRNAACKKFFEQLKIN